MYKTIFTVDGFVPAYIGFTEGNLWNGWATPYFSTKELDEGNNKANFTKKQWYGIVAHFIRQDYELTEEQIADATEDIVGRCFVYGIPKFDELSEYIADYMNR